MFRFRTVLATAAVAVAATLALAAPASAHDEIVASSPAAGEQLTVVPEEVVLTFSNNLLSLDENSGTAMTVVDGAGEDWVAGDPVVAADTVTAPLQPDMPNGDYLVTWKVVSSDGHPTSGEYSFSIAAEQAPTPEATESAEPTAEPTESEATAEPTAEPTQAPADEAAPWPLLIGLGVVLLVAVVLVVVMAMRKKR